MTFWASVGIGLQRLWTDKARSALTALGVVIGVASVIAVVAFGAGAQQEVLARIQSLGANLFIISKGTSTRHGANLGSEASAALTLDDAVAISREIPFITAVAPVLRGRGQAVRGNRNWQTGFQGVTQDYLVAREWQIISGRPFSAREIKLAAKVAIVGQTVAQELFGQDNPIGQTIRMNSAQIKIIGVLEKKGPSARGRDQDNRILIPLTTARIRVLGSSVTRLRTLSFIIAKVDDADLMVDAEERNAGTLASTP